MKKFINKKHHWKFEEIQREANKYKSVKDWGLYSPKSYNASLRRGSDFHKKMTKNCSMNLNSIYTIT